MYTDIHGVCAYKCIFCITAPPPIMFKVTEIKLMVQRCDLLSMARGFDFWRVNHHAMNVPVAVYDYTWHRIYRSESRIQSLPFLGKLYFSLSRFVSRVGIIMLRYSIYERSSTAQTNRLPTLSMKEMGTSLGRLKWYWISNVYLYVFEHDEFEEYFIPLGTPERIRNITDTGFQSGWCYFLKLKNTNYIRDIDMIEKLSM